jgi:predicted nucleic acid-binding protein
VDSEAQMQKPTLINTEIIASLRNKRKTNYPEYEEASKLLRLLKHLHALTTIQHQNNLKE